MYKTIYILVFQDRVSLCSIEAFPGIHSVGQVDLKLPDIHLPPPPKL